MSQCSVGGMPASPGQFREHGWKGSALVMTSANEIDLGS